MDFVTMGFKVVFVTLTQYGLCPSPPDAAMVEYEFDGQVCVLHLEKGLDYRQPIMYTLPIE